MRRIAPRGCMLMRKNRDLAIAALAVSLICGAVSLRPAAMADDAIGDGPGGSSDIIQGSGETQAADDGGGLIEDGDADIQYIDGVPMDQLEKVMASGNREALQSFADGTAVESEGDLEPESQRESESEPESELVEMIGDLEAADPDRIRQYLADLSEYDSTAGSDGELQAADYISGFMKDLGYQVETQPFHEGFVDETGRDEQGINIIAEHLPDSELSRTDDILLVVTHYDVMRKKESGDPFAADRSGTAALLETARILSSHVTDTDICFLFLSGEEDGHCGASNFVDSLNDETRARIRGVIDVERVGYAPFSFYLLKDFDGEKNSAGELLREAGLRLDARKEKEASEAEAEGGQEDADGETAPERTVSGGIVPDAISPMTETEPESLPGGGEAVPAAWSYVKDSSLSQAIFGQAGFEAAALTQYVPGKPAGQESGEGDMTEQSETNVPNVPSASDAPETDGSADTGKGSEDQTHSGEEDEDMLRADPALIADVSDILADAVSSIMDPNS